MPGKSGRNTVSSGWRCRVAAIWSHVWSSSWVSARGGCWSAPARSVSVLRQDSGQIMGRVWMVGKTSRSTYSLNTPDRFAYRPANVLQRAGPHQGTGVCALLNKTPWAARRSMLGVRATGMPLRRCARQPIQLFRSSTAMNRTLDFFLRLRFQATGDAGGGECQPQRAVLQESPAVHASPRPLRTGWRHAPAPPRAHSPGARSRRGARSGRRIRRRRCPSARP